MVRDLLDEIGAEQGWSDSVKLDLLIEYVERQQSPDALRDYLLEVQEIENAASIEEAPLRPDPRIDEGDVGPSP